MRKCHRHCLLIATADRTTYGRGKVKVAAGLYGHFIGTVQIQSTALLFFFFTKGQTLLSVRAGEEWERLPHAKSFRLLPSKKKNLGKKITFICNSEWMLEASKMYSTGGIPACAKIYDDINLSGPCRTPPPPPSSRETQQQQQLLYETANVYNYITTSTIENKKRDETRNVLNDVTRNPFTVGFFPVGFASRSINSRGTCRRVWNLKKRARAFRLPFYDFPAWITARQMMNGVYVVQLELFTDYANSSLLIKKWVGAKKKKRIEALHNSVTGLINDQPLNIYKCWRISLPHFHADKRGCVYF